MRSFINKFSRKNTYNKISLKLAIFLTFCIPPAIISGPFLSDLFVSIIALLFLIKCVSKSEYYWIKNDIIFILIIFYIYILIGSLSSDYILLSLESSLFYFRFILFAAALAWWILPNMKKSKILFYSILISYLFVLIDGFIQYYTGTDIFGYKLQVYHVSGPFGDDLVLGKYLAIWSAVVTGILISKLIFKREKLLLSILVFITADLLIFLSGQRVAFFMLLMSTSLILLFYKKYKLLRISTLVLSLILGILILSFNKNIQTQMIDKTINQLTIKEGKYFLQDDFYGAIYITAYNIFLDNPIFGIGVKNYREECKNAKYSEISATESFYRCSTHPHNTYLQILAETGIIGFSIFFIFVLLVIKRLFLYIFVYSRNDNIYYIFPLIGLLTILWPIMPTNSFFNNWSSVNFFFLLALLLNWEKKFFMN